MRFSGENPVIITSSINKTVVLPFCNTEPSIGASHKGSVHLAK